ncbi:Arm DNA-binding domain-containing protein [Sphingobacterium rhinopitheci]|uniref:Arm DNA-binding domain-containing protein n=1 Tax=Sphingobacterium rhinopitheci TaxID=2781960 RepID=UPI00374CB0DA|nr:hypothetical protein [Sphingobacterium rhinopitheci]
MTTRIYLRPNKQGDFSIYLNFTTSGKRKELFSNVYTSIKKWDDQLLKVKKSVRIREQKIASWLSSR